MPNPKIHNSRAPDRRQKPDFTLERRAGGIVTGVDEAGRGPWAGPVVAAAVILDAAHIPAGIDDSKRLGKSRRESLYREITASAIYAVGQASVEEIDRLNILEATMLAMSRAVAGLATAPTLVLIDGNRCPDGLPCVGEAVIGGDRRSLSIAAASIIAKVTRDRIMADLAVIHPQYGWASNAGYGTAQHRAALDLVGISPFHRKSFAPIRKLMTQENQLTN